uniref:Uncharacterized protein n=1 Tax=Candidatus Kentrum sp. LPFa TaxID=2126335 RepID=A0A450WIA4_9GAMM|nr:MAG: hypothetical protein BECKLPF1236B_GA0070989_110110 [Candidatus Kentron sp. LPFa]
MRRNTHLYPPGFLSKVAEFFQTNSRDGLSVRILDIDRDEDAFGFGLPHSTVINANNNAWAVGITPSMFLRQSIAAQVMFDENMGPGQRWVGGEDTDYLLCCLDKGARHYYSHELFVHHPSPNRVYPLRLLIRRAYLRAGFWLPDG